MKRCRSKKERCRYLPLILLLRVFRISSRVTEEERRMSELAKDAKYTIDSLKEKNSRCMREIKDLEVSSVYRAALIT